jgi:hypothetical protein
MPTQPKIWNDVEAKSAIGKMAVARPEVRNPLPFTAIHEKDMGWLSSSAGCWSHELVE